MTTEDLLKALRAAQTTEAGEGATVQELCQASGRGEEAVRKMLRPLVREGKVRPSRKYVLAMDGRRQPVASYVLVAKPTP